MKNINFKKKYIYILISVVLVAILAICFFEVLKPKKTPQTGTQPKTEILTAEEIQEALSKEAEPNTAIKPLTEKEISQSLNKKNTSKEKISPLTPEEIQKALQLK